MWWRLYVLAQYETVLLWVGVGSQPLEGKGI